MRQFSVGVILQKLFAKIPKKNPKNSHIFEHFSYLLANKSEKKMFETKVVHFSIFYKNGSLHF